MLDITFPLLQKFTTLAILAIFFAGRYSWSWIAGKREKTKVSKEIVSGRFWISVIVSAVLPLLLIFNTFNLFVVTRITYYPVAIYIIGLVLSLVGLVLMFLARLHRHKDWGFMGDDAGQVLFTKGVYSVTRHPYYAGAVFAGIGVYLVLNSWLVLIMLPVIFFMKKVIQKEDNFLFNKFGSEWQEYMNKTGIIPWL